MPASSGQESPAGASSSMRPCCTNCMAAAAVIALVMEKIAPTVSVVIENTGSDRAFASRAKIGQPISINDCCDDSRCPTARDTRFEQLIDGVLHATHLLVAQNLDAADEW